MDLTNPQSLNRYAYVLNNPLSFIDKNGKWPMSIHSWILGMAFPGLNSNELGILMAASNWRDRLGNQGIEGANDHSMCQPDQEDCGLAIAGIINADAGLAGEIGFNTAGLYILGLGIHTFTDMSSPWHSADDGTPLCWGCSAGQDTAHVFGENVLAANDPWAYIKYIGQGVSNALALFKAAYPDKYQAATSGLLSNISIQASNIAIMQTGSISPNPVLVNEIYGCLLGNPAACPDASDSFFDSVISGAYEGIGAAFGSGGLPAYIPKGPYK